MLALSVSYRSRPFLFLQKQESHDNSIREDFKVKLKRNASRNLVLRHCEVFTKKTVAISTSLRVIQAKLPQHPSKSTATFYVKLSVLSIKVQRL